MCARSNTFNHARINTHMHARTQAGIPKSVALLCTQRITVTPCRLLPHGLELVHQLLDARRLFLGQSACRASAGELNATPCRANAGLRFGVHARASCSVIRSHRTARARPRKAGPPKTYVHACRVLFPGRQTAHRKLKVAAAQSDFRGLRGSGFAVEGLREVCT